MNSWDESEYFLAGLRIRSGLSLFPPLSASKRGLGSPDLVITYQQEPLSSPAADDRPAVEYRHDNQEVVLTFPNVARFLVRAGSQILVERGPSADDDDLRAFLLGTIFAAVCHQRGILPLHAAAIDVPAGCVAFVGPSGAGKSTLAAALSSRGETVLSDDVCFISKDNSGRVVAWPGVGRLRLWEDALIALSLQGEHVRREVRGLNKFLVPVAEPTQASVPRLLRAIYQLESADPHEEPTITQLSGAQSLQAIFPNVYRLNLAEKIGRKAQAFSMCVAIIKSVPIFRYRRALGFEYLQKAMDTLEAHLTRYK